MKRSRVVTLGLTVTLATMLACGPGDDDDDCGDDNESLRPIRMVHVGTVREVPAPHVSDSLPTSGGFGTHLADCGG